MPVLPMLLYTYFDKTCLAQDIERIVISDATELEIGELSRAELSWILPSRAELALFQT